MIKALVPSISLVFLLIVSLLASPALAVPLSLDRRSLLRYVDEPRIIPDYFAQDLRRYEEERGGRKLLVVHTDDYSGTGANNKHDPSTGGR